MATKLDLVDAQFIGYAHGKDRDLIGMVNAMGMTKREYLQWKKKYSASYLKDSELEELDDYFDLSVLERLNH